MNRVALCARDGIMPMAGFEAPGGRRLIAMARETSLIDLCRREHLEIADIRRRKTFDMLAARSVAGLAAVALHVVPVALVHDAVRAFEICLPDVLVAHRAGFRAYVGQGGRGSAACCRCGGRRL